MKPLSHTGATHFVQNFSSNVAVSTMGVNDYLDNNVQGITTFAEGTTHYDELRDCLLRETERSLLMANNCYARSLDGLRGNSAYWSLVGLYYAAFYSAKAVLGIHGCWMGGPKKWIEVIDSNPGAQKIIFRKQSYPNNAGNSGTHKITWMAFYNSMAHLTSWYTSQNNTLAMYPVNANSTWLIDTRNDYNYYPYEAFQLMTEFQSSFDPSDIPNCFGGKLQTMLQVSKAFICFSKDVCTQHGLKTDVCSTEPTRLNWATSHITSNQHASLNAFAHSEYAQLEF
jgi:hypothetical protein